MAKRSRRHDSLPGPAGRRFSWLMSMPGAKNLAGEQGVVYQLSSNTCSYLSSSEGMPDGIHLGWPGDNQLTSTGSGPSICSVTASAVISSFRKKPQSKSVLILKTIKYMLRKKRKYR